MIKDINLITKEHIFEAAKILKSSSKNFAPSVKYDVVISNEKFPPKEVIRIAYKLATGNELNEVGFTGGSFTNNILEKLGFVIEYKTEATNKYMQVWKLGCYWETGSPSFYKFLFEKNWVIGVNENMYNIGDLIAITEGFEVMAIAKVENTPINIIKFPDEQKQFTDLLIPFEDWINIADTEWYELKKEERFQYKLQAGIRRVQNQETKNKIINIWNNRFKKEIIKVKNDMELNTILYGPPGTGKTYNTINKALEIIGFDTSNKSRQEIKDAFDKYVNVGQIVFTTFHQSMSYEDFIEGIKPETKDDKVLYKVKDGIFKTIANKAFGSFIANDNNKENYTSPTFDQLHSEFLESIKPFEGKEEYIFKTIYNHDIKLVEINGSTIVVMFRWQDVKKSTPAIQRFAVTKEKLKLLFEGGINPHTVKSLKKEFAPFMQHNLSVFYAVYKKFYEFIESKTESKSIDEVEVFDDYSFEEIFEDWQLQNTGEKEEAIQTAKKYLLIIDEINRGNVSQIFGELITLIEDDKRIGCKEQLLITLPYSKKQFGVPSNLYIIGTMNTADRSVEALDTALRRRFIFEEMMPNIELLKPQRMLWQLWWDYADVQWSEEPYKTKADGLYKLLGIESDFDPAEELWQKMKKEGKRESQISYFDTVEFAGINLQTLLETINKRIAVLLSRDNLIGHSYFISVKSVAELKTAFQNKIIPLLQEYFFGDYGKIGLVLGSEFVEIMEDETAEDLFADFEYDGMENFAEKTVYRLVDINNFNDDEFMNIVNSIF